MKIKEEIDNQNDFTIINEERKYNDLLILYIYLFTLFQRIYDLSTDKTHVVPLISSLTGHDYSPRIL